MRTLSSSAPFSTPNVRLSLLPPTTGTAATTIALALQPGGTNLWLAMAANATVSTPPTTTTTKFYVREIPNATVSSSEPSLGTPSNWAPFGNSCASTDVTSSAIFIPDPPFAVDASGNINSVKVGYQMPLIATWQPSLRGGNLWFGIFPNASAPYPFVWTNADEPFGIAPDGTLRVGDSDSSGITPCARARLPAIRVYDLAVARNAHPSGRRRGGRGETRRRGRGYCYFVGEAPL